MRGDDDEEVLRLVKADASFKKLRARLVEYLDGICLAEVLGVASTAALFESRRDLLHTTSILRYPVFVDGKNYSGSGKAMADVPALAEMVDQLFAPEIEAVPGALVVPLGKAVDATVATLVRSGRLDAARVLSGFPHPSGANAGGPARFARNQPALAEKVRGWSGSPAAGPRARWNP